MRYCPHCDKPLIQPKKVGTTPLEQMKNIVRDVADRYGMDERQIYGNRRDRHTFGARREAIHKVSEAFPNLSSTQLGKLFNRDHTSILNALGRTSKSKRYATPIAAE